MSDLAYPRPENVRGKFGQWVTADMFHISRRIQEIEHGNRLFIQQLVPPVDLGEHHWNFVIVEVDENGAQHWVTGASELDSRVIEHAQMLLTVPYAQRFAEAERLEAEREQAYLDQQLDEALENWGWDFRRQLEHDGFIEHRGVSYPKRGISAARMEPAWRHLAPSQT